MALQSERVLTIAFKRFIIMTAVSQLAKENMQRCAEFLECKEKIRFYQFRLTQLQEEHRRVTLTASLKADASSAWRNMSEDENWTKENVLVALQSQSLPDSLQEIFWEGQSLTLCDMTGISFWHVWDERTFGSSISTQWNVDL